MDDGISRPDWGAPEPVEREVGKFGDGIHRPDWTGEESSDNEELDSDQTAAQQGENPFHEEDAAGIQACRAALDETWGTDLDKNLDSVRGLLANAPKQLMEAMLSTRYADGRAVANDPQVLTWLASLVPGKGGNQALGIHEEIAQIERTMKENRAEYNKSETMQARLRSLYAARGS